MKKLFFLKKQYFRKNRIAEETEQTPDIFFTDSFMKLNSLQAHIKINKKTDYVDM